MGHKAAVLREMRVYLPCSGVIGNLKRQVRDITSKGVACGPCERKLGDDAAGRLVQSFERISCATMLCQLLRSYTRRCNQRAPGQFVTLREKLDLSARDSGSSTFRCNSDGCLPNTQKLVAESKSNPAKRVLSIANLAMWGFGRELGIETMSRPRILYSIIAGAVGF